MSTNISQATRMGTPSGDDWDDPLGEKPPIGFGDFLESISNAFMDIMKQHIFKILYIYIYANIVYTCCVYVVPNKNVQDSAGWQVHTSTNPPMH